MKLTLAHAISSALSTATFSLLLSTGLLVNAAADCVPPPEGLVSWWPGAGNGDDIFGGNNATLLTGITFTPGIVGQAFDFDGTTGAIVIPASSTLTVQNFTVETWINPTDISTTPRPIAEYGNPGEICSFNLWYSIGPGITGVPGAVYAFVRDADPNNYIDFASAPGLLVAGQWSHVAFTFDSVGKTAALFVNGAQVATKSFSVPIHPRTGVNLNLGYRPDTSADLFAGRRHLGKLDEVGFYNRALAPDEINAIYNAGSAGKCTTPSLPVIYQQPNDQTLFASQTASFTVGASGTRPLNYQWTFNSAPIDGATNATLVLPSVSENQAGTYAVEITNAIGSVLSSNATLNVKPPPPCVPPPTGLVSWWSGEGDGSDAAGNNNGSLVGGTSFAPGTVGRAFSFTAANQIVKVPNSPSLNPTSALTLEGWVFVTDGPSTDASVIVGKDDLSAGRQYELDVYRVGSQLVFLPALGTPGRFVNIIGTKIVPLKVWTHVAITYDGSTFALYVNGALDSSMPFSGPITTGSAPLTIGGIGTGPWSFFGDVDELSLYNRALTPAEVQAIYTVGSAGKCSTPTAPFIYLQPTNQTVFASQPVTFAVGASGTQPLSYQWTLEGATIDGATNATLTLTNVSITQAGTYAVQITNSLGAILSSNATLGVNPPPPCINPSSGLISWWQAEGSAADETGLNNASLVNGVTYAPGYVGQAFSLDGRGSYIQIPDGPSLALTSALTVELWYKDTGCPKGNFFYGLIAKRAPYPAGANFGISLYLGGPGYLQAYLQDSSYYGYQNATSAVPVAGVFHHVAATYSQITSNQVEVKLYVDGQLASAAVLQANLARTLNNAPVTIGADNRFEDYFTGLIDEPTIYHRALSDAEILAVYNAGISGKCAVPLAAAIYAQPSDQVAVIGQTVTFNAGVSGTPPFNYQWSFNGNSISGATDSSLVLTNVQRAQAGLYSLAVSNALGEATSSNAVLTVNFPPANVQIAGVAPNPDGSLTLPILLVANGNENAIGFSLDFSPALLNFGGATVGTAAGGAFLFANTNQLANGQLGIVISLPSGSTFTAGTQEIAEVSFTTAVLSNATIAQLSFGDQPTTRQLSDPEANILAANFTSSFITIPAAEFEGDASPRPAGDKALTVTDWVLVGRYAARLDYPTNASEYQRSDCAPRSALGDGAITVADWVQAGRYAVGLDPITRSGGPTNDIGPGVVAAGGLKETGPGTDPRSKGLSPRQVRVASAYLAPGQPGTISVFLDAQGNENALGFSVAFDAAILAYAGSSLGVGAAGATIDINETQAASGKLAFVLALPVGGHFAAGTKEILKLSFSPSPSASGAYTLALSDSLAIRQVVDPAATPLTSGFVNGTLIVNPFPTLSIVRAQQNVTLSWPLWATNFILQEADGGPGSALDWTTVPVGVGTANNEAAVTLPVTGTTKLYRLQKQ